MNVFFFIILLFGLQGICLFLASRSVSGLKTQKDYFLAGKQIRFFPLMMTFLATQVGGGLILGSAEEAYRYGWSVIFYPLGISLGLLLLGLGLGRKLGEFQVSTIAQIFEVVYRSATLKRVASLLSIVSLFMVLVAQIIASHKFMISLGVENKVWFLGFWALVIFYTAMGGLKAVVVTDVIQASFFVVVFVATLGFALYTNDVSWGEWLAAGFERQNLSVSVPKLSGWLLMPLLFMAIEQDMGQRCLAAESARTVSKATIWAAVCTLIVSVVPITFGVLARYSGIEIPQGGSVLMTAIAQLNPWLTACAAVAILCAIISTADSLINAIGSNLSQDFNVLRRGSITLSQILSAAIALLAIAFSFYFENVVGLLIQSYELSVSCLFVPILFALFKKQGNPLSATLAILCGGAAFLLLRWITFPIPRELLSIFISLGGFYCGEWAHRALNLGPVK